MSRTIQKYWTESKTDTPILRTGLSLSRSALGELAHQAHWWGRRWPGAQLGIPASGYAACTVPVTVREPHQVHFLLLRRFWILNVWVTLPGRSSGTSSRNQNLGTEKGHGGGYPADPPVQLKILHPLPCLTTCASNNNNQNIHFSYVEGKIDWYDWRLINTET